jgi:hypothetical protein
MAVPTINGSKDSVYRIPCSQCDGNTYHKVITSVNTFERGGPDDILYWEDYEIVQCQGCNTISFRKNWRSSEDASPDDEGNMELDDHSELFPGRVAGRQQLRDSWQLPPQIASIYNETHSALCNKLRVLTGVGIRALIEVVCTDKAAAGGNLEKQIDSLVNMGVLTKDGADILHSLRIMGNQAAHQVKPHSEEDLDLAFDVVEHLLKGVYLLPLRAKKLPKRGTKK